MATTDLQFIERGKEECERNIAFRGMTGAVAEGYRIIFNNGFETAVAVLREMGVFAPHQENRKDRFAKVGKGFEDKTISVTVYDVPQSLPPSRRNRKG